MKGFFNRYLLVDVGTGRSSIQKISDDVLRQYLGGKGLSTWLLMRHQPAGADPLSAENPFIIGTGPVNDTAIFGSSRFGVYSKSPLTGVYLESYSGGKVPEKISRTGFDAIVVTGRRESLCYLTITPDGAAVHHAADLKGTDCHAAENLLMERHGKGAGAVVVGPAAENLIPFSIVSNDLWRCAGRAGAGTVLGSKNVKAIVFSGGIKRDLADPAGVNDFATQTFQSKKDHPVTEAYKIKGTPMLVDILSGLRAFPSRYWHQGFVGHYKNLNPEAMQRMMDVNPHACAKCFMACGKIGTVKEGQFQGLKIEGPEYETLYAFGGLCMIPDITHVAYLNDLCDKLGIDTITAGNLIALAMEASATGRIKEEIPYGDTAVAAKLIIDIVGRNGIGEVLAGGIKVAAKEFGMEDMAIHVKGLEPAGYDPRYLKGMSLAYAMSDRGACHLRTTFYKAELSGMIQPAAIEGKVQLYLDFEDRLTLLDTLIFCRFYRDFYLWDELQKIVRITTGIDLSKEGLQQVAADVTDLVRSYNVREGVTARDDVIPQRFFAEPLPEEGYSIRQEDFDALKAEYYERRGWDSEGVPKCNESP